MRKISVPLLGEPPEPTPDERPSAALWTKGFRPFFVLAAAQALLFLPIWLWAWTGHVDLSAHWPGPIWHGHEMVFGFTLAVIAGFLLTAVSNWTGQPTATGKPLIALSMLWLGGRLAILLAAHIAPIAVAVIDLAFIPALAVAIGRPLIATRNTRNLMFIVILGIFGVANLVMHLGALGVIEDVARTALLLAVDLVIVVILIIAGRIIPMFTRNATGNESIRQSKFEDRAVVVAMLAVLGVTVLDAPGQGVLALVAGGLAIWRMRTWGTLGTARKPILWVLHVGHAWVGVGLLARGAGELGVSIAPSIATHMLTVGAIGTLTLGMMSRVALGHTGRTLVVTRSITFAYLLVSFAVLARAVIPAVHPAATYWAYIASGVAFSAAFGIYLVNYLPILLAPRMS